jgi:hypothetical protein
VHRLALELDEIAVFARRGARVPLGGKARPGRGPVAIDSVWVG